MKRTSRRKALGLAACVALAVAAGDSRAATFTLFTDKTNFEAAAGPLFVETFDDATLEPGVTARSARYGGGSARGTIANGVFSDMVRPPNGEPERVTYWRFEEGITAFGALWDLSPNSPGTGLRFFAVFDSAPPTTPAQAITPTRAVEIPRDASSYFWGFVSDTLIYEVLVRAGTQGGVMENYSIDNLAYSVRLPPPPPPHVPVPPAFALALGAFASFGLFLRRSRRPATGG